MKSDWVNISQALGVAKGYPRGPKTSAGLIWAGKKGRFSRKINNSYWEFNLSSLKEYLQISNKTTLRMIANKLGTSVGKIKYMLLVYQIPYHFKFGRKYLEEEDEQKIYELFRDRR